jgi:hypothetical protein
MLRLRLVIDTNVVISAALKPEVLQRTTFILAITKPPRLYESQSILEENADVLSRPELKFGRASACGSSTSSKTGVPWSYLRGVLGRSPRYAVFSVRVAP